MNQMQHLNIDIQSLPIGQNYYVKLLNVLVQNYMNQIHKYFIMGCRKYFTSFVANFCGPTSTTSSIEVATIFSSETGVILELEQVQNHRHLKCFNCSYLSAFGNEDERLFIQPLHSDLCVHLLSVRNMATYESYGKYINANSLWK
eukprot:972640_1